MKSILYLFFISILFSSMGQIGSDLYLPSLPAISRAFQTSSHFSQATVFVYIAGFSFSRLLYGPLSDAIGRRKPLIIGMLFFLLGTILCVAAHSITLLIIGRFTQGFGAAAGAVIAGAMLRDRLEGTALAQLYSFLGISNVFFIACAPLLGGYLEDFFNWKASFIFLLFYAIIALFASVFFFSETNTNKSIEHIKPEKIKSNLVSLFSNRDFLAYSACLFLVYGGILAWLTLGPILLQDYAGVTPVQFGWIAMIGGIFYILGSFLNSWFVEKVGMNKMIVLGTLLIIISGMLMLFLSLVFTLHVWIVIVPVIIFITGAGFIFPNAYAGALIPFPKIAGIAGAIAGCMQMLGGSFSSGLMSVLPDNSPLPLAIIFIFCGIVSFVFVKDIANRKTVKQ